LFVPILIHIVSVFGFRRRVRAVHRPLKNVRERTEKKVTTTRPDTEKGRTPGNYSLENKIALKGHGHC